MAEVLVIRTKHEPPRGHGKDIFCFFMKRPTKKAKALVADGTLYDVGCELAAQFVKDNPGWVSIGCEDDAHYAPNQGVIARVRAGV